MPINNIKCLTNQKVMEILGKNVVLKYSLRSMFVWEEMLGKPFEINTLLDTYCFCYACIIVNPDNPQVSFDEFINYCDEHPEVMKEFNEFLEAEHKKRDVLQGDKKKVKEKETS